MSVFYLKKDNSKLGPISRDKILELYRNQKINLSYSILTQDNPPVEMALDEFCRDEEINVSDNINTKSEPHNLVANSATGIQYASTQQEPKVVEFTPDNTVNKPSIVAPVLPNNPENSQVPNNNSKAKKKRISIKFRRKKNGTRIPATEENVFSPTPSQATPPPIPTVTPQVIDNNTCDNFNIENSYNYGNNYFQQSDVEMITCSHCWSTFPVECLLFISLDYNNLGDPVAGANSRKRFVPESFNNNGQALDHNGVACSEKACPVCHLKLIESTIDLDNVFLSIVGAPASGKSYLLASMVQQFRSVLSRKFAMTFTDADAQNNITINNYIDALFYSANQNKLISLPKTEIQGNLYHQISWQGSLVNLPMPFVFTLQSSINERNKKYQLPVNVTFYDNAGEHFQPGMDDFFNPGTKHLGNSEGIIFCFDVSKEVRIAKILTADDPQLSMSDYSNQVVLFGEMAARIRKFCSMNSADRYDKVLIINVMKCDLLKDVLDKNALSEQLYLLDKELKEFQLNFSKVLDISYHTRSLLQEHCPDFIQVVEGFCSNVYYIPTSSTGNHAEIDIDSGNIGIRPKDVQPLYSELPLMTLLAQQGYIRKYYSDKNQENQNAKKIKLVDYNLTDDTVVFYNELSNSIDQLPKAFFGIDIYDYNNNCYIEIPGEIQIYSNKIKDKKAIKKGKYNDYQYSYNFDKITEVDKKMAKINDEDFWDE